MSPFANRLRLANLKEHLYFYALIWTRRLKCEESDYVVGKV